MLDNRTKVELTASELRQAEDAFIMAMELSDPRDRPKRIACLHLVLDATIKHHNAIEDAKRNSRR
jgi:hypothetical protein